MGHTGAQKLEVAKQELTCKESIGVGYQGSQQHHFKFTCCSAHRHSFLGSLNNDLIYVNKLN